MYKRYFGLTRNPFEISPDPAFLVPTPRHNEALANLYYGVRRQKGFVVVTGEVGTGKTLLLKCLLDVLNHDQIAFAYVFNPRLTVGQFFQYVLGDLGIKANAGVKSEMLLALNNFLISRYRKSQTTVLVVDEAQHLSRVGYIHQNIAPHHGIEIVLQHHLANIFRQEGRVLKSGGLQACAGRFQHLRIDIDSHDRAGRPD